MQTLLNTPERLLPSADRLVAIPYTPRRADEATANNPMMGMTLQQVENAGIEHRLESSKVLPDFNIGVTSQTIRGTQEMDGRQRTFDSGNRFNSIQFGLSIPLFYSSSKAKVKAARIKAAMARNDADNYAMKVRNDYLSLVDEYSRQQGVIGYYEKQAVPEADMIISQSEYGYRRGEIAYSEYIVNVSKALEIKQNYIEAINNYNQTVISLESVEGKTH